MLWIRDRCPQSFADLDSFHNFLLDVQHLWGDQRSCKQRRADRVPTQLRDLYSRIQATQTEDERKRLQRTAWSWLEKWLEQCNAAEATTKVKQAKVLTRSKKLHSIQALVIESEQNSVVAQQSREWYQPLETQFSQKWGCSKPQDRANLLQLLGSQRGIIWALALSLSRMLARFRHTRLRFTIMVSLLKSLASLPRPALALQWLSSTSC